MIAPLQIIDNTVNVSVVNNNNDGLTAWEAGHRYYFPDVPELRSQEATGLIGFSSSTLVVNGDGIEVWSVAEMAFLTITLFDQSSFAFISNMPLLFFMSLEFDQVFRKFESRKMINTQSCYIQPTRTIDNDIIFCVPFSFSYIK